MGPPRPDATNDPGLRPWVAVPLGSPFPVQNLPFGVFRYRRRARVGVAIGDHVLDMAYLQEEGLLAGIPLPRRIFARDSLNGFLALGRPIWRAVRHRLCELLTEERWRRQVEPALLPMSEVELMLPIQPGDYVDFYASLYHASNMGRILRPQQDPLPPNWRWLPIGYHGRSATVVVSGRPVRRPWGQVSTPSGPIARPTRMLDFELEVGFVTGRGNQLGSPIPVQEAWDHIFGLLLVNDWSARDIQAWEYVPLGPFLGKSFATSISPWLVTLEALAPFLVPMMPQDPPPLPYLAEPQPLTYDVQLEVALVVEGREEVISRTNMRYLYWSLAQMLAHATSNGALARPGDLWATGTISGPEPGTYGCLMELTWGGQRPLTLRDGSQRTFLEDGDTVVMRGWCEGEGGLRIGLGEVRATVLPPL
jgi:fumarylacetoacetase